MASLSRDAILGQFDRLQKEGELFYNPTQPQRVVGEGLEVSYPASSGKILCHSAQGVTCPYCYNIKGSKFGLRHAMTVQTL